MEAKDISQWQQAIAIHDNEPSELESISKLVSCTRRTFSSTLKLLASAEFEVDPFQYEDLRQQFITYFFWHEGFCQLPEGIDQHLSNSPDIKATLLDIMVLWAEAVLKSKLISVLQLFHRSVNS